MVLNCDVLFHPQLLADLLTPHARGRAAAGLPRPDDRPVRRRGDEGQVRGGRVATSRRRWTRRTPTARTWASLRFDAAPPLLVAELEARVAAGDGTAGPRARSRRSPRAPAARHRDARPAVDRNRFPGGLPPRRRMVLPHIDARLRGGRRRPPPIAVAARTRVGTMYEKYFQLRERPFALSPDPEYLYPSNVHQEALATCATASKGTPASSSSPARSVPVRRRCCRRCSGVSIATRLSPAS